MLSPSEAILAGLSTFDAPLVIFPAFDVTSASLSTFDTFGFSPSTSFNSGSFVSEIFKLFASALAAFAFFTFKLSLSPVKPPAIEPVIEPVIDARPLPV